MPLIGFSCLLVLANISSTFLDDNRTTGNLALLLILVETVLMFPPYAGLKINEYLYLIKLYIFRKCPSIPSPWVTLSGMSVDNCKRFPESIKTIIWFSSSDLFIGLLN